jgi:hypothetical protein
MQIRRVRDHIGVDSDIPRISPARGPLLWYRSNTDIGEGIAAQLDWATHWDGAAQTAPDFVLDQRINGCPCKTETQTR